MMALAQAIFVRSSEATAWRIDVSPLHHPPAQTGNQKRADLNLPRGANATHLNTFDLNNYDCLYT
jgi:hypothetical protein